MLTFLLLGLLPLTLRKPAVRNMRWVLASIFLCLSGLIKYATLPVGLVLGVNWMRQLRTRRLGFLWIAAAAAIVGVLTAAIYWPWFAGVGTLAPALDEVNGRFYHHSIPGLVEGLLSDGGISLPSQLPSVSTATLLSFAGYVSWELWRLWRNSAVTGLDAIVPPSAGILLVALVSVAPDVYIWYFTWPLTLVALLGWHSTLMRTVVAYSVIGLPVYYAKLFELGWWRHRPRRDVGTQRDVHWLAPAGGGGAAPAAGQPAGLCRHKSLDPSVLGVRLHAPSAPDERGKGGRDRRVVFPSVRRDRYIP